MRQVKPSHEIERCLYASAVMQRGRRLKAASACMEQGAMDGWLHCHREIELINEVIEACVPVWVIQAYDAGRGARA